MNTTMQWADLWTNGLKRWEQKEYLRKERGMMMESESTKMLLSITKSMTIVDLSFKDKKTLPYFPIESCDLTRNYKMHFGSSNHETLAAQDFLYKKGSFSSRPKAKFTCLWQQGTSRAQPCNCT